MPNLGTVNRNRNMRGYHSHFRRGIAIGIGVFLVFFLIVTFVVRYVEKSEARLAAIELYHSGNLEGAIHGFDTALAMWAPFDEAMESDMLYYKADALVKLKEYAYASLIYGELYQEISLKLQDMKSEDKEYATLVEEQKVLLQYQQMTDGLASYVQGKFQEAIDKLSLCVNWEPKLYMYVGSAYGNLSQWDMMLSNYENYSQVCGDNGYVCSEIATYYLNLNEFETALNYINRGLLCEDEFKREVLWTEIVYLSKTLQFEAAYEKIEHYKDAYALTEEEEKEYVFLKTR